ncbi:uncharacterized protein V6R79_014191 [Siganus canaliculatus]
MKLNSFSVLCLALLLLYPNFSMARKGGGSSGRSSGGKKSPTSNNRGSTHTSHTHTSHNTGNTHHHHHHGSGSNAVSPRPGLTNKGSHPPQWGGAGNPRGGGYHYPAHGSPYGRGYGSHGGHGSHGHGGHGGHGSHGGYGGYGGHGGFGGQGANTGPNYGQYGGGYINQNPNRHLSPHYVNSFGYGAYGGRGGSPFSNNVQRMGMYPSDKSRGYGQSGAMAAAKGAVVGAAVGYGVGRFQRPHFHFRNRNEEQYYNRYMYNKYGTQSTDDNDYSRDYKYSQPAKTYDNFMDSCMRETDLREEDQHPKKKPAVTTKAPASTMAPNTANTTVTNSTAADNSSASSLPTPRPLNESEASPAPPDSRRVLRHAATDFDDGHDTVSIMQIGYPALINQMKARRCVEKYMVYSEKYLKKNSPSTDNETNGLNGVSVVIGSRGLLAMVTGTVLMLLTSNTMLPY